jgi:hypothetical protein
VTQQANRNPADIALLPDAGPLITLAYADALDLLFKPGWTVVVVDMVLHEVTRQETPTSAILAAWAAAKSLEVMPTRTFARFKELSAAGPAPARNNLGELAIQEAMNELAIAAPPRNGVFLFEDHRIARTSFLLPDNSRKISTRAYLWFLQDKGWIESAAEVERYAIAAGRQFSQVRFPPVA